MIETSDVSDRVPNLRRRCERKWGLYRSEFDDLLRGAVPIFRGTSHLVSRLALEVTVQTTAETGPQVKPREALQEAGQVPSAKTSPIALQVDFRLTSMLSPQTTTRDAVDFAI